MEFCVRGGKYLYDCCNYLKILKTVHENGENRRISNRKPKNLVNYNTYWIVNKKSEELIVINNWC